MDKTVKKEWNDALFHLEKVLQSMGINEQQQEELTKSLASFGETIDNLLRWITILDKYASKLDSLGETDAHTGPKTLENRLNLIEGMQSIFCSAHKGHTNYSEVEFLGMHGASYDLTRLDGIQKKLDRIIKFLEKFEVKMSVKDALQL